MIRFASPEAIALVKENYSPMTENFKVVVSPKHAQIFFQVLQQNQNLFVASEASDPGYSHPDASHISLANFPIGWGLWRDVSGWLVEMFGRTFAYQSSLNICKNVCLRKKNPLRIRKELLKHLESICVFLKSIIQEPRPNLNFGGYPRIRVLVCD